MPLKGKAVLEVGPGRGVLTKALLKEGAIVTGVEVDPALARELRESLGHDPAFYLVEKDILKVDVGRLLQNRGIEKVVSNLPYSITTPLLYRLCVSPLLPAQMVLMVQLETAMRITAQFGEKGYSPLGILLGFSYRARMVHRVSPQSFRPRPKVESAIISLERHQEVPPPPLRETAKKVLSWGFAHPRKMLLGGLSLAMPGIEWRTMLERCEIDPKYRPHQVPPEKWLCLASTLPDKEKGEQES